MEPLSGLGGVSLSHPRVLPLQLGLSALPSVSRPEKCAVLAWVQPMILKMPFLERLAPEWVSFCLQHPAVHLGLSIQAPPSHSIFLELKSPLMETKLLKARRA